MEFQTQKQLLLDFLRAELKNGHIQLVLEIQNLKVQITQLTSRGAFFKWQKKIQIFTF